MGRRQQLTLLAAICGSAAATIEGAIVIVALPAVERDFRGGLTVGGGSRMPTKLSLSSLILLGSSLGGVWGRQVLPQFGVFARLHRTI